MSNLKIITDPSVYMVSGPVVYGDEFERFLCDHNVGGWLSSTSKPGDMLPEIGGRVCYMSFSKPRPGGNAAYLKHILEVQHGSVLEHSSFGFIFAGVSRSLTHELVRHRAGMAYSQLSQRYVDESDVAFVCPPAYVSGKAAYEAFAADNGNLDWCDVGEDAGGKTATAYGWWLVGISHVPDAYASLIEVNEELLADIPEKTARRKAAREAARSVLPNCTETKIMVTGNCRAWRNFLEQRGAVGADAEIRRLALALLPILRGQAPAIFGDYTVETGADGIEHIATPYHKV